MPYIDVQGETIWIEDSGGDNPAVVFCHGFFLDGTMFEAQVASLSNRYRCITWDERGFGGSSATKPFTYWDSAGDAIAILDHLSIARAVFIGMSKGGYIALRAALRSPERVAALVLIGSESGVFTEEEKTGFSDWVRQWQEKPLPTGVRDAVTQMLFGPDPVAEDWHRKWEQTDRSQIHFPAGALINRDDISAALVDITCPSLVIHGTGDEGVGIEKGRKLAKGLRTQKPTVEIFGGPHAVNITHSEPVNAAINEFLGTLRLQ
jgi:3-oxoadipate enol-lactonase